MSNPSYSTALPRLDRVLLDNLFCPVSRKLLEYDHEAQVLISRQAGLVYPISHNIPLLVEELATPLDQHPPASN
ncbi:MAG: Trm112 family protein [Alphaproteobacteria bacterium]|nr:Trm112 family protein [Alphaproteobacteria bacterium]